ncbi:hypothetical protein [Neisseria sicca]|uniref:hypothetical protein n=1 Tax=Neisseria sicca TaxID=490 RepID=UPI000A704328|nr:hypothetical protein [Neisseria sicca]
MDFIRAKAPVYCSLKIQLITKRVTQKKKERSSENLFPSFQTTFLSDATFN